MAHPPQIPPVLASERPVKYAGIGPIAVHLPKRIETNELLQAENPAWKMDVIASKTGILQRHVADPDECSTDLGVKAAEKLFRQHDVDPRSIDFLLFCTQTPDYALPTSACLIQHRLGMRNDIGALDYNLGCSAYPYGLSVADGLIRSGLAQRVLLVTGETYTKMIHATDRSLRTIFGDGGTATLIEANDQPSLWGFRFGTDGSGADTLIANDTGFRDGDDQIQPRHRKRWPSKLYMDGPSLMSFTVGKIPEFVDQILEAANVAKSDITYYLFHQATLKMLEHLREALDVQEQTLPVRMEHVGNTVSCTLPLLIDDMRQKGELDHQAKHLLVGFGVGWSWSGCVWQDVLGGTL